MCPIGDTAAAHIGADAVEYLHRKPNAEHDPSRYGDDADKDHEENEDIDAGLGVKQEIAAHQPRNGTGRADGRDGGLRIESKLREIRSNTRDKVELEEGDMPHRVLKVIAKYPQKQHVTCKVHKACVYEH